MQRSTMNSKERVLAAVNHQLPDRVPISFAGNNLEIDRKLKAHFNLAPDDDFGLLDALHVDVRQFAFPAYHGPKLHADVPDRSVNPLWGSRRRWVTNDFGGYWDFCDFPLQHADQQQAHDWPMPNPDHFDYDQILAQAQQFKDYAVAFGNPGLIDIMNATGMVRGVEETYMDMVTDGPGLIFARRKAAVELEITRRVLEKCPGLIDIIWIGEDLGTQIGPLISLDTFRSVIRPIQQQFVDLAAAHDLPVMIHCCGSSSWAFNDFIDMGIKIVDTLQPEATNMAPAYLKQNFGDKLCFHGCISTAGLLAIGTADQAIANLRETLDIMMPQGGYIMSPTHNIQDNTPVENVIAVYEETRRYGIYQ